MMIGVLAMTVYIGCYSDAQHTNALHALAVNRETGAMTRTKSYAVKGPIYLAKSADGKYLFAPEKDGIASFTIDAADGLTRRDFVSLQGRGLCHVAVMPSDGSVVWAGYTDGRAGSVAVQDGRFGKVTAYQHAGKGPNQPRQNTAHCHQALPTPDGKSYVVVDLGIDTLMTYPAAIPFSTTPSGAGPRHLVFHPNGRLAFVVFELWSQVASYAWDAKKGFVKMLDQQPSLLTGDHGRGNDKDLAAAIRMSPDGTCVIVSNRGEQSLVTYACDAETGKLTFKARSVLPGSWPRDFIFLTDTLAIVTMERTNEVHTLRYDPARGTFTVLATLDGFYRPVAALPR